MLRANFVGEGACYNSIKDAIHVARGCLQHSIRAIDRALVIQNIDKLLKLSKRCEEITGLQENLWVICATTGIKWTHLADMYGFTYDESNNNQKALFPNCFSFKSLF